MARQSRPNGRDPREDGQTKIGEKMCPLAASLAKQAARVKAGGEQAQVPEAPPECADARHAIALAAQVPAQATNPLLRLFDGWSLGVGREFLLGEAEPQRLPFVRG